MVHGVFREASDRVVRLDCCLTELTGTPSVAATLDDRGAHRHAQLQHERRAHALAAELALEIGVEEVEPARRFGDDGPAPVVMNKWVRGK